MVSNVSSRMMQQVMQDVLHPVTTFEAKRLENFLGSVLGKQAVPHDQIALIPKAVHNIAEQPTDIGHWSDFIHGITGTISQTLKNVGFNPGRFAAVTQSPEALTQHLKEAVAGKGLDLPALLQHDTRQSMTEALMKQAKDHGFKAEAVEGLPARFALSTKDGKQTLQLAVNEGHVSVLTHGQFAQVAKHPDSGQMVLQTPASLMKQTSELSRKIDYSSWLNDPTAMDAYTADVLAITKPFSKGTLQDAEQQMEQHLTPVLEAVMPTLSDPFKQVMQSSMKAGETFANAQGTPQARLQLMEALEQSQPAIDPHMQRFMENMVPDANLSTLNHALKQKTDLNLDALFTEKGYVGKEQAKKVLSETPGWTVDPKRPDRFLHKAEDGSLTVAVGLGNHGPAVAGLSPGWKHIFVDEENSPQLVDAMGLLAQNTLAKLNGTAVADYLKANVESTVQMGKAALADSPLAPIIKQSIVQKLETLLPGKKIPTAGENLMHALVTQEPEVLKKTLADFNAQHRDNPILSWMDKEREAGRLVEIDFPLKTALNNGPHGSPATEANPDHLKTPAEDAISNLAREAKKDLN